MKVDCDILIIGTGAAGPVLAATLAEKTKERIVLVERDEPWEGRKPLTKQFLHWSWGIGRGPLDKYAKARQAL